MYVGAHRNPAQMGNAEHARFTLEWRASQCECLMRSNGIMYTILGGTMSTITGRA